MATSSFRSNKVPRFPYCGIQSKHIEALYAANAVLKCFFVERARCPVLWPGAPIVCLVPETAYEVSQVPGFISSGNGPSLVQVCTRASVMVVFMLFDFRPLMGLLPIIGRDMDRVHT